MCAKYFWVKEKKKKSHTLEHCLVYPCYYLCNIFPCFLNLFPSLKTSAEGAKTSKPALLRAIIQGLTHSSTIVLLLPLLGDPFF